MMSLLRRTGEVRNLKCGKKNLYLHFYFVQVKLRIQNVLRKICHNFHFAQVML